MTIPGRTDLDKLRWIAFWIDKPITPGRYDLWCERIRDDLLKYLAERDAEEKP
jgi:hypothetical protein